MREEKVIKLDKNDIYGVLSGRKSDKLDETLYIYIRKEILYKFPYEERVYIKELNDGIYSNMGNLEGKYRYTTSTLYPPKGGGSVLDQAVNLLEEVRQEVEKKLNSIVIYERKEIHID